VFYKPDFGNEQVNYQGGPVYGGANNQLFLIFWGSYWGTNTGSQEQNAIAGKVSVLLQTPYLNSLAQYKDKYNDTVATSIAFQGSWIDTGHDPSNGFSTVDLMYEVENAGFSGIDPNRFYAGWPLYAVITPPGISSDQGPNVNGYMETQTDRNYWHLGGDFGHMFPDIWAAYDGNSVDRTTLAFSRGLVNALSNPAQTDGDLGGAAFNVQPGANWPQPGGTSMGDFEPTNAYTYRLSGALTQAYWSQADNSFVVPDGNTQGMFLQPLWSNGVYIGSTLNVNGDQLGASYNNTIEVSTDMGAVSVALNGEDWLFEPGQINNVVVNAGSGNDKIDIEATALDVGVTVNLGAGADTVNLSGIGHDLTHIEGPITVAGGSGKSVLNVYDDQDVAWTDAVIDQNGINGMGQGQIFYGSAALASLNIHGDGAGNLFTVANTPTNPMSTTHTLLISGSGNDNVYVQGSTGPLTVNGGGGHDVVYIGKGQNAAGTMPGSYILSSINGPVTVTNMSGNVDRGPGSTSLTIDDSGDTLGHNATLTANVLKGMSQGTISWVPKWISTLKVLGGKGGNTIQVPSTGPFPTTLSSGGGNDNVDIQATTGALAVDGAGGNDVVTIGSPGQGVAGTLTHIAGQVTVTNSAGATSLVVQDGADTTGESFVLTNGLLSGLSPTPVAFTPGQLKLLKIVSGTGNDTLTLGAAPTMMTAFNGGTGTNTLVGPNLFNNWNITGPNAGTLGKLNYAAVQDLVGGAGVDVFSIIPGGNEVSIDGGGAPAGQGDWLDYSAFTTMVNVNLATGSATAVNAHAPNSIKNIQDVHAGSGNSNLTGNAQGNILVGGVGSDTIKGGTGRSLLIGDLGADNVTGGSTSGGDILIGGSTGYDQANNANLTALMAIMAEWQSADSYNPRFTKINQGMIPGGYNLHYGTTVIDDGAVNALTGAASPLSLDWFFAGANDQLVQYVATEHKNNY
jgi:hypothetical protein